MAIFNICTGGGTSLDGFDMFGLLRGSTSISTFCAFTHPCERLHIYCAIMQSMPNWDDIRIFLALERSGTLLGAGKALRVNHTTVARRLVALETDLGARLFDRTPDGYVLTPLGTTILPFAQSIEEEHHALERQVTGHDARVGGVVRIATTETFAAMFFVPKILGELRARHPDIYVEVVSTASAFDLPRRQADLAIRMTRPTQQGLVVK